MNYRLLLILFTACLLWNCSSDPIEGCMDPSAVNFNPEAEIDDGNCIFTGCTDPEAANYDPMANQEDGNCIYPGCTDDDADNYDPKHNEEDGSCVYFERYEGKYEGEFECMEAFADLLDLASSEIIRKPGDDNTDQITVIVSNPATEINLVLDGTITKDEAVIDTYIENFEYTLEIGEFTIEGPFEVIVTGTLIRAEDNSLSGPISIRITQMSLSVADTCIYTATKI